METKIATPGKSPETQNSPSTPSGSNNAANLLTRADYGVHVTGRVEGVTPPTHRSGTSDKGKPYAFWQQSCSIVASGAMFDINWTMDTEPAVPPCTFQLDDIVRVKVKNPRLYGGKVSFDHAD